MTPSSENKTDQTLVKPLAFCPDGSSLRVSLSNMIKARLSVIQLFVEVQRSQRWSIHGVLQIHGLFQFLHHHDISL